METRQYDSDNLEPCKTGFIDASNDEYLDVMIPPGETVSAHVWAWLPDSEMTPIVEVRVKLNGHYSVDQAQRFLRSAYIVAMAEHGPVTLRDYYFEQVGQGKGSLHFTLGT